MRGPTFTDTYLEETVEILRALDDGPINRLAVELGTLEGRLFVLGNGGSAATASHATNDFRKCSGIEAYCPTDNVAELTARTNDDGWDRTFRDWLEVSRLAPSDALLVLSVGGGGDLSPNIREAVDYAWLQDAPVFGIVGRDGGWTAKLAKVCVIIPPLVENRVTPHTEGICSVICHLLVSHPALQR